ncbi:MAG TPA: hypothetical protein VHC96_17980 [Puia sp.]|nr:hypothetical protein [Puia sp.]
MAQRYYSGACYRRKYFWRAIEEVSRERRIGLYLRGVAFYDARRWGVTEPVVSGGGRAGDWDVPQNELDFNIPASGSAPTAN